MPVNMISSIMPLLEVLAYYCGRGFCFLRKQFQVIAMTANLGCACCRQKVFQLTSRMTGLREYTVDVRNKRVIVKGDVKARWNTRTEGLEGKMKKGQCPFKFFSVFSKQIASINI